MKDGDWREYDPEVDENNPLNYSPSSEPEREDFSTGWQKIREGYYQFQTPGCIAKGIVPFVRRETPEGDETGGWSIGVIINNKHTTKPDKFSDLKIAQQCAEKLIDLNITE